MKRFVICLSMALALGATSVQAKRMGGGKSVGAPSGNVTQREAAKPAPAAPGAPAQQAGPNSPGAAPAAQPSQAAQAPAAAKPAAAQTGRNWGGILGGLAAGLGLAWLAHTLGFGEAFGQILLFGLIALGLMMVFGYFMRRRTVTAEYAGAGPAGAAPSYNPKNVGNDASARPWEQGSMDFEASAPSRAGTRIGSRLIGGPNWTIPDQFDVSGFVTAAKQHFVDMQAHWDKGDLTALRAMMTDVMYSEIQDQLREREQLVNGPNHTEVVSLEAQLLGIEDLGSGYMASVEFSGLIREDLSSGPAPFREVWNMTKPADGSTGWVVAGIQAFQ
ncbi:MAG: hypothetical protein RL111_176 [Pseudomonadota bacterium]|jgi:predicted lipid-binding transport protein (Tim44 family)